MMGIKAAIGAPMLWEGKGIGSILVGRDYPGPFPTRTSPSSGRSPTRP